MIESYAYQAKKYAEKIELKDRNGLFIFIQ